MERDQEHKYMSCRTAFSKSAIIDTEIWGYKH